MHQRYVASNNASLAEYVPSISTYLHNPSHHNRPFLKPRQPFLHYNLYSSQHLYSSQRLYFTATTFPPTRPFIHIFSLHTLSPQSFLFFAPLFSSPSITLFSTTRLYLPHLKITRNAFADRCNPPFFLFPPPPLACLPCARVHYHGCHTNAPRMPHGCHTDATLMPHECHTRRVQVQ